MKHGRLKFWLKNVSYTVIANSLSMIISSVVILLVPKVLAVENYGYFQIYLFYINYVGFLQFGWIDGIYLRYAGKKYSELDKPMLQSQFISLAIFQITLCIGIVAVANVITIEKGLFHIIILTAICMILTNLRGMLLYILQITFRIKEYAIVTVVGRILYGIIIIALVTIRTDNYVPMIYADIAGRSVSLAVAIFYCRDIVFRKLKDFKFSFLEIWVNLSIGIKLMLANISNLLIIGIVRWAIQLRWDVDVFAKLSLTLSVSNLLVMFVSAVGAVVFPILKRTEFSKLGEIYLCMRELMTVILYGMLVLYYPVRYLLAMWLPKYADSLYYMALLFPMCIYSSKTILLGNSFLNTMRKEKIVMNTNIVTVILSVVLTAVNVFLLQNLTLAVVSIVILLAFRMFLAEYFISKYLSISLWRENVLESILTGVFIFVGLAFNSISAVFVYSGAVCIFIFLRRKRISSAIKHVLLKNS